MKNVYINPCHIKLTRVNLRARPLWCNIRIRQIGWSCNRAVGNIILVSIFDGSRLFILELIFSRRACKTPTSSFVPTSAWLAITG
jgi:hypothetical protein